MSHINRKRKRAATREFWGEELRLKQEKQRRAEKEKTER
mgnify:FL=1